MPIYHTSKQHRSMEKWFLLIILLAAFLFRFQHIKSVPPGLYPDEAINGNEALIALESGDYKVFYSANNGREGLYNNILAQFFRIFPREPWTIRLPAAVFGFLTVLGLYLLVQQLFNWQIAAIASWFLATGFWHVNFSRIGFRAILAPFLLTWAFYFLWQGLYKMRLWAFGVCGVFLGLGFYTYIGFRAAPMIIFLVLWAYFYYLKQDYSVTKYEHLRTEVWRGIGLLLVVSIIVAAPIGIYFLNNPGDFFGRAGQISVFNSETPVTDLFKNFAISLGMFVTDGDYNWRHNFAGAPQLLWPVGVFFVVGLIRSFIKLFRRYREHSHVSVIQVLLLSWFFVMLLPAVLSNEGLPHALRAVGVIPVAMIFASEGLWWFLIWLVHWYRSADLHPAEKPSHKEHEAGILVGLVLVIFLFAIGVAEYDKYFNQWAKHEKTADAFSADYLTFGKSLNQLYLQNPEEPRIRKYIIVDVPGVSVNGIPMPAQSIMFITQTYTSQLQKQKNIFYLPPEQFLQMEKEINEEKPAMIMRLSELKIIPRP